jgi:sugar-specific transcriptional regulator TrmB
LTEKRKIYITADEVSELLGVSKGYAYKLIRKLNKELEDSGYIVISGKVPKRYFEKRWFGYSEKED